LDNDIEDPRLFHLILVIRVQRGTSTKRLSTLILEFKRLIGFVQIIKVHIDGILIFRE